MPAERSREGSSSAAAVVLGPLETEVMDLVWARGEVTVRDVYKVLLTRREIAYTTVMTVMGNLAGKGVLRRNSRGRTYVYASALSRDEFTRSRIAHIVDNMFGRFTEPAMTYLVDRMAEVDPERLAELEKAIARLRKNEGVGR
ncbi:MAG: BlaI/MecI/CopY family transcriptional regulator [Dehalococcoidia bacterium]|nr:BlaI/MecI/CopY family transcriptional regulator [Dehalococcoidia bacterium]